MLDDTNIWSVISIILIAAIPIAVLATIAIPEFFEHRARARKDKSNIR